ncbi:MAG: hypothetical protein V2I43_07715 [Parvularcula sp.]|jgi:hypothetical protein|nr:hypothetical protein [Parvularcula sp.]
MADKLSSSRVRIALARLLFTEGIDVADLYHALGCDPSNADGDALAHLAGVLDGMDAASRGIRDHGLEGWSKPR